MSAFTRLHKATALVPLALVSAAWTVTMAGAGATASADDAAGSGTLPDGSTVPAEAIQAPASLSSPAVLSSVAQGDTGAIVASSSTSGIPAAALTAYQRAEAVINAADKGCEMPWELIAAIGRVESDHGRVNGNTLSDDGVAQPGIYGIALDGTNNTQKIVDTDAGQYDSDTEYDRAIGPMQFIPSTWSVVGVDGDNDGKRNPQDIDDAALASAVYLCSGDDDLSTEAGQRSSVYRYNHSNDYVDLVLDIMRAYMDGDYTSVPNSTTSSSVFLPTPSGTGVGGVRNDSAKTKGVKSGTKAGGTSTGTNPTKPTKPKPTSSPSPTATTSSAPAPIPTSSQPPAPLPTDEPTKLPTKLPTSSGPVPVPPPPSVPAPTPLTLEQATAECAKTINAVLDPVGFEACVQALMNP